MDDWSFRAKYKVICTECAHDEFEQAGEKIRCSFCQTEYQRPDDSFHLEPFDLKIDENKEH